MNNTERFLRTCHWKRPFWKKINTFKNNFSSNTIPKLIHESKEFKSDIEKGELFKSILSKTFSIDSVNTFDEDFFNKVEKFISDKEYLKSDSYIGKDKSFPEITLEELKKNIKTLKEDSAPGQDNINNKMLKNLPNQFLKILVAFFNKCLSLSLIPESWKVSRKRK